MEIDINKTRLHVLHNFDPYYFFTKTLFIFLAKVFVTIRMNGSVNDSHPHEGTFK